MNAGSGKTTLTVRFIQGIFLSYPNDPLMDDSYVKYIEVDGESCRLEIQDTMPWDANPVYFDKAIKQGEVFILCCSLTMARATTEIQEYIEQVCRMKGMDLLLDSLRRAIRQHFAHNSPTHLANIHIHTYF